MIVDPTSPHPQNTVPLTGSYFFVALSNSRGSVRYADIIFSADEAGAIYWTFYNFAISKLVGQALRPLDQSDLVHIDDAARGIAQTLSRYARRVTVMPWDTTFGPILSFEPKRFS